MFAWGNKRQKTKDKELGAGVVASPVGKRREPDRPIVGSDDSTGKMGPGRRMTLACRSCQTCSMRLASGKQSGKKCRTTRPPQAASVCARRLTATRGYWPSSKQRSRCWATRSSQCLSRRVAVLRDGVSRPDALAKLRPGGEHLVTGPRDEWLMRFELPLWVPCRARELDLAH